MISVFDIPDDKTLVPGSHPVNKGVQKGVNGVLLDGAFEVFPCWAEGVVGWPLGWYWLGMKPLLPISEVGI